MAQLRLEFSQSEAEGYLLNHTNLNPIKTDYVYSLELPEFLLVLS